MENLKNKVVSILRYSEKYTKTDMVYLVKNSFWLNSNTIIVTAFSLVLSVAFARLISKEVYGTYQFIISLSTIIGAVTLTGMNTAVTQAVARGFEGVFPTSVKIQIKYGLIPFILGLGMSLYYALNQNLEISVSMIAIAILLPLTNALNTWASFLNGKKEFGHFFKLNQWTNIIYYAGMITAIIFIPNIIVLVILNFLLNTISNFLVYKLVIKKFKPNNEQEEGAISFGKKFSLSNILPMIALSIDNIIVFHFLGAANLAIYAFASNIPERLGSLLRPISTIALPKFSEQNTTDIRRSIKAKIWRFSLFSLISWIIYVLLSPILFKLFFPNYLDSIFYSQIYALVVVLNIYAGLIFAALSSTRSNTIFKFNTINPIFNIIVIFVSIYFWGIWGAVMGKITGTAFQIVTSWYFLKKSEEEIIKKSVI
jgi:O-antigen/teichoic acid export membrane protein